MVPCVYILDWKSLTGMFRPCPPSYHSRNLTGAKHSIQHELSAHNSQGNEDSRTNDLRWRYIFAAVGVNFAWKCPHGSSCRWVPRNECGSSYCAVTFHEENIIETDPVFPKCDVWYILGPISRGSAPVGSNGRDKTSFFLGPGSSSLQIVWKQSCSSISQCFWLGTALGWTNICLWPEGANLTCLVSIPTHLIAILLTPCCVKSRVQQQILLIATVSSNRYNTQCFGQSDNSQKEKVPAQEIN